jgi:predicted Zn-dependent protease
VDDLATTRELLNRQLRSATAREPIEALTAIGAVQRDISAHQREAVRAAVQHHSWTEIGEALGVSKQAAHQKFAKEWAETLKGELKAEHSALKTALREGTPGAAEAATARRDAILTEFKNANRKFKNESRGRK